MAPILEYNKVSPEKALSIAEIISNSTVFVLGGTEPTTLAIVGTIQELLTHPSGMQRLCGEIRAAFATGDAITAESTRALPYLDAVLKEGLRMWPPFPDGLRRVLMPRGATIAGRFVPGGSTVSSSCWCTFSSETYFAEPDVFAPQRWMEDNEREDRVGRFTHDRKDVFHPFALGPRNCPAQALAWAKMRVFLAKLLWDFDVKIKDGKTKIVPSKRQRIFWHWQHPTLDVEIVKR
jgi:cytochrome P450